VGRSKRGGKGRCLYLRRICFASQGFVCEAVFLYHLNVVLLRAEVRVVDPGGFYGVTRNTQLSLERFE